MATSYLLWEVHRIVLLLVLGLLFILEMLGIMLILIMLAYPLPFSWL